MISAARYFEKGQYLHKKVSHPPGTELALAADGSLIRGGCSGRADSLVDAMTNDDLPPRVEILGGRAFGELRRETAHDFAPRRRRLDEDAVSGAAVTVEQR